MIIKVFGCPSIKKELYLLASLSKNDVEVEIIPPGLSREQLQQKITADRAERIVLAFGQRRLEGLHSGEAPVVAPRAHDCAGLLLGSAERYRRVFAENEDSPVWLNGLGGCHAPQHGPKCAVRTTFPGVPLGKLPDGVREYASDLSLLKAMLEMDFDDSQAMLIPPRRRITADPSGIIDCEPL